MSARYPHAKLPGKAALEKLYVKDGLSYRQIGEKFGCPPKTVYNTMKRRADAAGTTWPLKQGVYGWEKRKAAKHSEVRWDGVTAEMVKYELHHARATLGVTLLEITKLAGVSKDTVWQISSGHRKRISRATAHKIMGAIEKLELRAAAA